MNPVPAPLVSPLRRSLVTAARTPTDSARWFPGVAYQPEAAVGGGGFDPCESVALDDLDRPDDVAWDAFGIFIGETCSTFGNTDLAALESRVLRRLTVQTPHLVEQVFSTLILQDASDFTDDHPNVPLYDATATDLTGTGTPVGLVTGFRLLQTALADLIGSAQGFIHAPIGLAPFLEFYGLVYVDGNQLRTRLTDHVVVLGTGYAGLSPDQTEPDDGVMWVYATSPVEVRLGEIEVRGVEPSGIDRSVNDIEVRATRPVLAHWDLSAHVAVPICIPDPGPDCPTVS